MVELTVLSCLGIPLPQNPLPTEVDILMKNNRVGAELFLRLLRYLSVLTRSTSMRYGEAGPVIYLVSLVCTTPGSSME